MTVQSPSLPVSHSPPLISVRSPCVWKTIRFQQSPARRTARNSGKQRATASSCRTSGRPAAAWLSARRARDACRSASSTVYAWGHPWEHLPIRRFYVDFGESTSVNGAAGPRQRHAFCSRHAPRAAAAFKNAPHPAPDRNPQRKRGHAQRRRRGTRLLLALRTSIHTRLSRRGAENTEGEQNDDSSPLPPPRPPRLCERLS